MLLITELPTSKADSFPYDAYHWYKASNFVSSASWPDSGTAGNDLTTCSGTGTCEASTVSDEEGTSGDTEDLVAIETGSGVAYME